MRKEKKNMFQYIARVDCLSLCSSLNIPTSSAFLYSTCSCSSSPSPFTFFHVHSVECFDAVDAAFVVDIVYLKMKAWNLQSFNHVLGLCFCKWILVNIYCVFCVFYIIRSISISLYGEASILCSTILTMFNSTAAHQFFFLF